MYPSVFGAAPLNSDDKRIRIVGQKEEADIGLSPDISLFAQSA
jgi:hypothetical protein